MLTSNTVLLQRLEGLKKQLEDVKKEIDIRILEKRVDNDGMIINKNENGSFALVDKQFYMETLMKMGTKMDQMKRHYEKCQNEECKCKEEK